ncbi:helix-turn-helix transcriptional regulator [Singulisphaera sp. PoT]|uniref:helix-turn-helix transcriptional regulator n=1 Tax=Singulisphaera sp. PoT TaxID=3411797 RepID=UPI003BF4F3BE
MTSTESREQDMQFRPIDPLFSVDALAKLLVTTRRSIDRMRSSGRLPEPDLYVGKMPRWRASTIDRWIGEQRGVKQSIE